jgi:hypothetical protein
MNILDGLRKWNTWKIMRWSPAYKQARRKVEELATDLVNEGLRYGLAGNESEIVEVIYDLCKHSKYDIYTAAIKVADVIKLQFSTAAKIDVDAVRKLYRLPQRTLSVPVFTGER